MQHKVSRSPGGKISSRSPPNLQRVDSFPEPKSGIKPRADVGNTEVNYRFDCLLMDLCGLSYLKRGKSKKLTKIETGQIAESRPKFIFNAY